jgi:hypothetical protein
LYWDNTETECIYIYREELDRQMQTVKQKVADFDREKYDYEQRRVLENNNKVFTIKLFSKRLTPFCIYRNSRIRSKWRWWGRGSRVRGLCWRTRTRLGLRETWRGEVWRMISKCSTISAKRTSTMNKLTRKRNLCKNIFKNSRCKIGIKMPHTRDTRSVRCSSTRTTWTRRPTSTMLTTTITSLKSNMRTT